MFALGVAVACAPAWVRAAEMPSTVEFVKSAWVPSNEWMEVCPCDSWDDVASVTAHTAGSAMPAGDNTVKFEFADGVFRLAATQTQSVARMNADGQLEAQFQFKNGGYIKCVKLAFKVEGGRLYSKGVYARYMSETGVVYPHDFDVQPYSGMTFGSSGYGVDKLKVKVLDLSSTLVVAGAPEPLGTVTPTYGRTFGYASGDPISPVKAPASWTSGDGSRSASCAGWKLYTQAEYGGEWTLSSEGSSLEPNDLVHPGLATRLVWQWVPFLRCTAVSAGHGTVSPAETNVAYGTSFIARATPDAGYFFAAWSGVPDARRCDNPLVLPTTEAIDATATFLPIGSTAEWTGAGADALASNPQNWKDGVSPIPGQSVLVTGDKSMTWDLAYPVGDWTQRDYTGVVTFHTVFEGTKATGFPCLVIQGNADLQSGTWTHRKNDLSKDYRLNVRVLGNLTVGPNAVIQADGCGYDKCVAVDGKYPNAGNIAGSYGGHGGFGSGSVNYTYGSYAAPEDPGNGGYWSTFSLPAGGAIRIEVVGDLVHNGAIRANSVKGYTGSGDYYSGSGGGIYVIAGSISGRGTLKANAYGNNKCGGGGRIAVKLTKPGSDFSAYDLVHLAEAIPLKQDSASGAPGTIYGETAADTPGEGWLVMKGNGTQASALELSYADPFTFETKSLHFARMTFTNNVMARVHAGCTLDLRGTTCCAKDVSGRTNGIRLNGGSIVFPEGAGSEAVVGCRIHCLTDIDLPSETLVCRPYGNLILTMARTWAGAVSLDGGTLTAQQNLTLTGDVTVKAGGILCTDARTLVNGSVTVKDGGRVTHAGPNNSTGLMKRLDLQVTGGLTIEAGGAVDVTAKGHSTKTYPSGAFNYNGGASHGGVGWKTSPTEPAYAAYDSIYTPDVVGGGSSHAAGGGLAILTVGGALRNDGAIYARGGDGAYRGAGGSIRITAGTLSGGGVIDAGTDWGTVGRYQASGGGRIAVTLTGAGADFGAFPMSRIKAAGDAYYSSNVGGAGTVYLRTAAQAADEGTLIVRNVAGATGKNVGVTPIGNGVVEGTVFGTVIITNNARVTLADAASLTVRGDWLNFAAFEAGAGSVVSLAGASDCRITGNTSFASLGSVVSGKRITVDAGSTLTVTEALSLTGSSAAPIELGSSDPTAQWTLDNRGGTTMTGVKLSGCRVTNPITVVNGVDGGNNTGDITFITITPGETIVWTGAKDSSWGDSANWDRARTPIATDHVVIGTSGASVKLGVDAAVASLTLREGTNLDVGSRTLTVEGSLSSDGTLAASAGGGYIVSGDVTLAGACSLLGSKLSLVGTSAQTLSVADGLRLSGVRVSCPSLTVSTSITCDAFTVVSSVESVTFAEGVLLKTTDFVVTGAAGDLVTLQGAAGATWRLGVSRANVAFANVRGSDASSGVLVLPTDSKDGGDNVNWMFTDTRVHWDGVSQTTAADDVVIDSGCDFTIGAARTMKSLQLVDGAKLTVNASFTVVGSVTVESGATLVWNVPGKIGGNLTVLSGGTLTHSGNSTTEAYKISLDIAGSGFIQAGATVTGKGLGYTSGKGPGSAGGNVAGSYGGRGYVGDGTQKACYGSILCPTNCGSGGGTGRSTRAGGAVRLAFGGDLTLEGTVDVDGHYETSDGYYTGSGGSVWLTARSLVGAGIITADGGQGSCQKHGAGGRIALWLTGQGSDFSGFTGAVHAWGGINNNMRHHGSAGTVFRKRAGEPGVLTLSNAADADRMNDYDRTDFPSPSLCDPDEALGVDVVVERYATLNVTRDFTIRSLKVNGTTARILLNGHVLKVSTPTRRRDREAVDRLVTPGGTSEAPGRIQWAVPGLMLLVR